jgi:macrodomain Ter protein organizer (MatP/YcbG family)
MEKDVQKTVSVSLETWQRLRDIGTELNMKMEDVVVMLLDNQSKIKRNS